MRKRKGTDAVIRPLAPLFGSAVSPSPMRDLSAAVATAAFLADHVAAVRARLVKARIVFLFAIPASRGVGKNGFKLFAASRKIDRFASGCAVAGDKGLVFSQKSPIFFRRPLAGEEIFIKRVIGLNALDHRAKAQILLTVRQGARCGRIMRCLVF